MLPLVSTGMADMASSCGTHVTDLRRLTNISDR